MSGLADLPGGGELAAMAEKVKGDPGAIRDIAKKWRDAARDAQDYAGGVGRAVRTVDAAWQGRSANAFVDHMNKYGKAADGLHNALVACAGALEKVATALENAKSRIDGICADVVAEAAAHRGRNPDATAKELEDGLRDIVQRGVEDARPHLRQATTAVGDAVKTLGARLGGEYRDGLLTFARIPDPGKQDFVPRHGHAVDWQRTPGYTGTPGDTARPAYASYGRTSLSGVNGGNGGFGGYGPSGPPPAGGGPAPTGQVKEWIEQAIAILRAQGYPAEKMNPNDIWLIIRHESGGNPHAINNWDSNAAAGTPSKGLMQTIDPTFNRWSLPGHKDIWNPVDNIIAGVRYAIARYGSVSAVPGVVGMKTGTGYRGY
ncbi:transglycosylase [Microbispora rosea subsp. aerata]|nr:transglycosylase SLT domain-containing protein [Microbispora rosea]GGO17942.1 transglycosylase [Microbispora rosea subsp. aerata]GIH56745.1 transglycosylase [Microbispora rosea subsp. aerata]GLJ82118.1 transglycosylase [Microbispora rosea subsp. aerata]